MNKRILSFLIALVMVASTFIISRPLVHVHAVDNEQYVEGENMWTLPTDWSTGLEKDANGWDMPYIGNWKLLGYTDLDTAAPKLTASTKTPDAYRSEALKNNGHGYLPGPYLGNNANESAVQAVNSTTYDADGWYTNWNQRWSGKTFAGMAASVGNGIYAIAHAGKPGAITFTAPSTGLYSYTETVEQVLFIANAINLEFEVTVRRNGQIIDIFNPTAGAPSATLDGKIVLNEGDKLMFAFEQTTGVTFSSTQEHKSNDPNCIKVTDLVVKKVAEKPEGYVGTIDLTPEFEMGSFTDKNGNVTLMGYQTDAAGVGAAKLYELTSWEKTVDGDANQNKWIAIDPKGKNNGNYLWGGLKSGYNQLWAISTETGLITNVGGAQSTNNTASAIVFTAPNDGLFAFKATMSSIYLVSGTHTRWHDYIIMKGDGTILDFQTNEGKTASNTATTVAAYVELFKGEKVIIVKAPNANCTQKNFSANGNASISISEIDHVDVPLDPNYKGKVELLMSFDGTSFTDKLGMFTLMGYNTETGAPYSEGLKYEIVDGNWYVYEPKGTNTWTGSPAKDRYLWYGKVNGDIDGVGGHLGGAKYGSTVAFTAPCDGTYEITASMKSAYSNHHKAWSEYLITAEDGTVLAIADNEGLANNTAVTVTYTATLSEGETVYIIRRPKAGSTKFNVSCEGEASVTVNMYDHTCNADTLKHVAAVPAGCEGGNREYYACICGINYADANANEVITGSVELPGTGHANPDEYASDANNHWMFCDNGCGEYVVEVTAHSWENGVCTVCAYACQHEWNAETGVCTICGLGCEHRWNEGVCDICSYACAHKWDAVVGGCSICALECTHDWSNRDGICANCGFVHNCEDFGFESNHDGTHKDICNDCNKIFGTVNCKVYEEGNKCACGYDCTVIVETNDLNNAINNIVNGGTADVTVVGPTGTMADDYLVDKIEGVAYEYKYFNIAFDDEGKFFLRHHFVSESALTVTVNGTPVELKSESANVYYFDVYPVAGQYHVADEISVNGDVYYVSLYSYIKLALETDGLELTDDQVTLLKALYDLNEALR